MRVHTISDGCPICKGPVTGSSDSMYLCTACKLLFRPPQKKVQQTTEFVTSAGSSTYHVPACKYAKRIERPIQVTRQQMEGMRPCKCVKTHVHS